MAAPNVPRTKHKANKRHFTAQPFPLIRSPGLSGIKSKAHKVRSGTDYSTRSKVDPAISRIQVTRWLRRHPAWTVFIIPVDKGRLDNKYVESHNLKYVCRRRRDTADNGRAAQLGSKSCRLKYTWSRNTLLKVVCNTTAG